jgi:hypothetical protein
MPFAEEAQSNTRWKHLLLWWDLSWEPPWACSIHSGKESVDPIFHPSVMLCPGKMLMDGGEDTQIAVGRDHWVHMSQGLFAWWQSSVMCGCGWEDQVVLSISLCKRREPLKCTHLTLLGLRILWVFFQLGNKP